MVFFLFWNDFGGLEADIFGFPYAFGTVLIGFRRGARDSVHRMKEVLGRPVCGVGREEWSSNLGRLRRVTFRPLRVDFLLVSLGYLIFFWFWADLAGLEADIFDFPLVSE